MADIHFEEENYPGAQLVPAEEAPWSIRKLQSLGIARSEAQAKYLLLGIAVFFILLALSILFFSGSSPTAVPLNAVNAALRLPDVPVTEAAPPPGMPTAPVGMPNPYVR